MKRLLLFGGTTEGRQLAQELAGLWDVTVCVATEYGRELLPAPGPGLHVQAGRLTEGQMEALLAREGFDQVVDATHPYASAVTQNIRRACGQTGTPYPRLLRAMSPPPEGCLYVPDAQGAARALDELPGNGLLTTGSKELEVFTQVRDFASRLYPRMLPMGQAVEKAAALGFPRGHIIAMQGPFSTQLNVALIRQFAIETLVTKDGGGPGGFWEKWQAARQTGIRLLVIGRPEEQGGACYEEVLRRLKEESRWK